MKQITINKRVVPRALEGYQNYFWTYFNKEQFIYIHIYSYDVIFKIKIDGTNFDQ